MTNRRLGSLRGAVVYGGAICAISWAYTASAERRALYRPANHPGHRFIASPIVPTLPRTLGQQVEVLVNLRESLDSSNYVWEARGLVNRMNGYWTKTASGHTFDSVAWGQYLSKFYYALKDYRELKKNPQLEHRTPGIPSAEERNDYLDLVALRTSAEYLRHVIKRETSTKDNPLDVPTTLSDSVDALLGRLRNRTLIAPGGINPAPIGSPSRQHDDKTFIATAKVDWEKILTEAKQMTGEIIKETVADRNGRPGKDFLVYRDGRLIPNGQRHPFTAVVIKQRSLDHDVLDASWDRAFLQLVVDEGLRINTESKSLSYLLGQLNQRLRWNEALFTVKPPSANYEPIQKLTVERYSEDPIANDALRSLRSLDTVWSNYSRSIVRGYWNHLLDAFVSENENPTVSNVRHFIGNVLSLLPEAPLQKTGFIEQLEAKRLDFGR